MRSISRKVSSLPWRTSKLFHSSQKAGTADGLENWEAWM